MNLSDQVCSLELAKKLKELGVKQESLFYFNEYKQLFFSPNTFNENSAMLREYYSAFTISELLETFSEKDFNFYKTDDWYLFSIIDYHSISLKDKNLPNCLAKMLIYTLENKLMALEEENK